MAFAGLSAADGGVEEEEEEARLLADGVAFALVFFADPARLAAGAFLAAAPFLVADFFLDDGDDFVVFLDAVAAMMLSHQLR